MKLLSGLFLLLISGISAAQEPLANSIFDGFLVPETLGESLSDITVHQLTMTLTADVSNVAGLRVYYGSCTQNSFLRTNLSSPVTLKAGVTYTTTSNAWYAFCSTPPFGAPSVCSSLAAGTLQFELVSVGGGAMGPGYRSPCYGDALRNSQDTTCSSGSDCGLTAAETWTINNQA